MRTALHPRARAVFPQSLCHSVPPECPHPMRPAPTLHAAPALDPVSTPHMTGLRHADRMAHGVGSD
jgi:hypothetical protein